MIDSSVIRREGGKDQKIDAISNEEFCLRSLVPTGKCAMLSEIFIKPMRCEKKSAWIFSAFELLYFAHVFTQEHILQHFCPIKIAFSLFPPA